MSRSSHSDQSGFTLIELLVVVTIIALLAAIAIPIFAQQREKGEDASAKSNARNLVSHMHQCFQEEDGFVGCAAVLTRAATALPVGTGVGEVQVTAESLSGYTLVAESGAVTAGVNHLFYISYEGLTGAQRLCTPANSGGCPLDTDGDGYGEW